MDPNEALRQIRTRVAALLNGGGRTQDEWDVMSSELAELVDGLDQWLTRGGFPPEAWREGPDAPEERVPLGPPNPAGIEIPEGAH